MALCMRNYMYIYMLLSQVVPVTVCAGLPVCEALSGAGRVSGLSHAGHRIPMLQEELH